MRYVATHVSAHDGSDAMALSYDPLVLVNEDGYTWAADSANWIEIVCGFCDGDHAPVDCEQLSNTVKRFEDAQSYYSRG